VLHLNRGSWHLMSYSSPSIWIAHPTRASLAWIVCSLETRSSCAIVAVVAVFGEGRARNIREEDSFAFVPCVCCRLCLFD
jgi:hypothetical protein